MGFALSSLALLVLISLIMIYRKVGFAINFTSFPLDNPSFGDDESARLYEAIAGYGLGGSAMALFGRVGGGIYTKAADVGADLVGKVEQDLPEDSPKNPATIADNVGDNVGDIAGMGSDLFGSFAEATCAGLVVLAEANNQRYYTAGFQCTQKAGDATRYLCEDADVYLMYPLMLSALALIACLVCSIFATHIMKVNENQQIEATLRYQLIISTVLLLITLWLSAFLTVAAPSDSKQTVGTKDYNSIILPYERTGESTKELKYYALTTANGFICSTSGLVVGLAIGLLTEYYTSNNYRPVEEVAESCKTGAATNIIYGLALGYLSTIYPVILLAIAAYISHVLLGLFGIALAALGMLSNLAVGLAVDAYGPISDNAGGIAEMCELGEETRHRTDALDAAGNTTAAIGKGFAIGSAAFVSLSLYGAFITRATNPPTKEEAGKVLVIDQVQVTDALLFAGLLIGAMLPYAFSAMTMKAVGRAALQMVIFANLFFVLKSIIRSWKSEDNSLKTPELSLVKSLLIMKDVSPSPPKLLLEK